jgi:hypothetical protein
VGAGTGSVRTVKLYDNVIINGATTATGAITVGGQTVVLNNDSRLSDARAPSLGSVTDASISASANVAQSKISGLVTALAAKAPQATTYTKTEVDTTLADMNLTFNSGLIQKFNKVDEPFLALSAYSTQYPSLYFQWNAATKYVINTDASGNLLVGRGASATPVLTLEQAAGKATFAGDVAITGDTTHTGYLYKNNPWAWVSVTNTMTIPHNSTTKILFNNVVEPSGQTFYSVANNRFTAPVTGLYAFTGTFQTTGSSVTTSVALLIRKISSGNITTIGQAGSPLGASLSHTFRLLAGDFLEVYGYQNTGSSQNCQTGYYTQCTLRLVG